MGDIKHVVVTGAAGLIGSAVVRLLGERGIRATSLDLTLDGLDVAGPSVCDRLDAVSPDAVVHAAAHPGGKSLQEPVENVRVNALGSMRVFEWCARAGKPVVYTSSSAVYGEQPIGPISETTQVRPGTVYAVAKVACEEWLRILGEGYGLQWTVLRLFATYGAGHRPNTYQGIVNVMLTQLLAGDRIVVRGSLDRQRDLVYVADAAQAIVDAVYCPASRGNILNVGSGVALTIREIIENICCVTGHNVDRLEIVEEPGTVGDPLYSVADTSRAAEVLGFSTKYSFLEGLRELVGQRRTSGR